MRAGRTARPKAGKVEANTIARTDRRGCPPGAGQFTRENGSKFGNPEFVPTDEQRRATMLAAAAGHSQETIAARLNISLSTLKRHLLAEFNEGKGYANGCVGEVLLRAALAGDVKAIDSWFDRRGGPHWRRITGHEQTGKDGGPIRLSAEPARRGDLAQFSEEELEQLASLTARLEAPDGT